MVKRFSRDLTIERLRNGVFRSIPELIAAAEDYISLHHHFLQPFAWTAKFHAILAKVVCADSRLSSKQNEALH